MTQSDALKGQSAGTAPIPRYFIDEGWYDMNSRSLQSMIDSRLEGAEGQREKGGAEKPTKRRTTKAAAKAASPMEGLAKVEGFIHPELSILEAVFRLLLVNQNKPMEVTEISQELAEHGIGVMDTRQVNPRSLERILDGDFYYGIKRYQEA